MRMREAGDNGEPEVLEIAWELIDYAPGKFRGILGESISCRRLADTISQLNSRNVFVQKRITINPYGL